MTLESENAGKNSLESVFRYVFVKNIPEHADVREGLESKRSRKSTSNDNVYLGAEPVQTIH